MLMQRHPQTKTIWLYPDVLGCVLDGFACGEPAIPYPLRETMHLSRP